MINLKHHLLRMGRTIFHQRDPLAPDGGIPYSLGPSSHDHDPRPTLFFYWHEPLSALPVKIPVRETRGLRSWFSRLGLTKKSV